MSQRRHEYVFEAICQKLKLNPSRWIPHIKTQGIYEMGTGYDISEEMIVDEELGEGTPVPIECFSLYTAFETICRERAKERLGLKEEDSWVGKKLGFWYEFWGFLAEVDLGVYDTTAWVLVESDSPDIAFYQHHR